MKSVAVDITGQRFGRLVAIGRAPREPRFKKRAVWLFRCDCGNEHVSASYQIRTGAVRSCGCFHDERCRERATKHGQCNTREYRSWSGAKTRCYNAKTKAYANYGGRGITMANEWVADFEAFLRDTGPCPQGHSLDRIDVNGPYAKHNCRWATLIQQANNCRTNRLIRLGDATHTTSEWERELGMTSGTLKRRLYRGTPLTQPVKTRHWIEFGGRKQTASQWAREVGIHINTLLKRLQKWGIERALTTPALHRR